LVISIYAKNDMGEEKEQETPAVLIYRVSTEAEWNELQQTGSTLGGDLDKQTGCIHLSTDSQVPTHSRPLSLV